MENDTTLVPKVSLSDSAKSILDSLVVSGYLYRTGELPIVTEELKKAAQDAIVVCDQVLLPCSGDVLKSAIFTLLMHFYTKDLPESVQRTIAADWINALKDYPGWAVYEARQEWLNNSDRKPTPANIRKLCQIRVSKYRAMKIQCKRIMDAPIHIERKPRTAEEKERVHQMVQKAKRMMAVNLGEG